MRTICEDPWLLINDFKFQAEKKVKRRKICLYEWNRCGYECTQQKRKGSKNTPLVLKRTSGNRRSKRQKITDARNIENEIAEYTTWNFKVILCLAENLKCYNDRGKKSARTYVIWPNGIIVMCTTCGRKRVTIRKINEGKILVRWTSLPFLIDITASNKPLKFVGNSSPGWINKSFRPLLRPSFMNIAKVVWGTAI